MHTHSLSPPNHARAHTRTLPNRAIRVHAIFSSPQNLRFPSNLESKMSRGNFQKSFLQGETFFE